MICIICDTDIIVQRDGFYTDFDPDTGEEIGKIHDDCALREEEFLGNKQKADHTYAEMQAYYKNRRQNAKP